MMFVAGLLKECPIHLHVLFWICKSTLFTLSFHNMFNILSEACVDDMFAPSVLLFPIVSDPCSIACVTSELKMRILESVEMFFELHIFLSMLSTTLALLILF